MFSEYQLNEWLEIVNYWDWKRLKYPHVYIVLAEWSSSPPVEEAHSLPVWPLPSPGHPCYKRLPSTELKPGSLHYPSTGIYPSRSYRACVLPEVLKPGCMSKRPRALLGNHIVPDGISRNSDSSGLFRNQLFEWSLHVAGPGSHVSDTSVWD